MSWLTAGDTGCIHAFMYARATPESLTMNRVYCIPNPDTSNIQPPKLFDRYRQGCRLGFTHKDSFQGYYSTLVRYPSILGAFPTGPAALNAVGR